MLSLPHKIKGLVKELQDLVKEMETVFGFDSIMKQDPKLVVSKECCKFSGSVNQIMIGRGDQLEKVVKILAETNLPICITGMAGIRKSLFTRCLCNTNEVKAKYPLIIWVSSTVEFDLITVMRSVIEYVSEKSCSLMDPEALRSMLANLLLEKDFILVLDNFDTEDYEIWHILCDIFDVGSTKERRVIITTRNSKLSYAIGAKIFRLPTITDNNCWNVMKQRHFLNKSDNIEVVGMELAKLCCGLPSVAKTLGDMLHLLPDQEWNSILQCNLWDLPQFKNYVVPNMLLSYSCLAPNLKRCFSYLALFPQGFEYKMSSIVQLWMAEGLIHPISGRGIEEVGQEYFKELIYRSFFHSQNEDPNDCSVLYRMHDWNHYIALVVSSGLCILSEDKESSQSPDNIRHLSMHHGNSRSMDLQKFSKSDKLRTFIWLCPNGVSIGQNVSVLFGKFKLLRVLDLESSGITEVPDSIGDFKHLRYVNLANNSIMILPESICKLSRLLVLILKKCRLVSCLPENFCRLNELQHLYFDIKNQIRRMPKNIKFLVKIQSLSAFIVEAGEGRKIEELKHLSLLSGLICITGLEHVTSQEQAAAALLHDKEGLKKLELEWRTSVVVNRQEDVLAGLQPNRNVEELTINNYSGKSFPPWISDSQSCRLRIIHLRRCQLCHTLPLLGKLQFLEHLIIECMSLLKSVCQDPVESGDFPALKSLWFFQMPQLVNWGPHGFRCMRQLQDLKFNNCPKLIDPLAFCLLTNLQNLEFSGCEKLDYLRYLPPSIDTLIIQDCPGLKTRCQVNGIQWNLIKGVPNVYIDGVKLPTKS